MGNTILAHTLFACNQIELDLENFFSDTGNAHKIYKINKSNLCAEHLVEYPDDNLCCILTVECNGWQEILRKKLSYAKWYNDVPKIENISKFFPVVYDTADVVEIWQDFYQSIRDPQWPECKTPTDVVNLPTYIQQEIALLYEAPKSQIETEQDFVSWLSICYYDSFTTDVIDYFPNAKKMTLEQYLVGDNLILEQVCVDVLKWNWDKKKSKQFYKSMLLANQPYFEWLEDIKSASANVINNKQIDKEFECWEQALIIAKACEFLDINPRKIKWDNTSCKDLTKSIYLEKFKRIFYGKTI